MTLLVSNFLAYRTTGFADCYYSGTGVLTGNNMEPMHVDVVWMCKGRKDGGETFFSRPHFFSAKQKAPTTAPKRIGKRWRLSADRTVSMDY